MTIFVIHDYEPNEITFLSYPMTKYWRKSSKHNQHMSPEQPTHAIEKTTQIYRCDEATIRMF